MTRLFILLNSWIMPYHAGVVFAMAMSMSQARDNQEIIANLYWVIPVNLVFASLPHFLMVLLYLWKKEKKGPSESVFQSGIVRHAASSNPALCTAAVRYFWT